MAWKEVLVMEERMSFVLMAERRQQSFRSLCAEYGISRGLVINRPNQIWCADITYIPMARGYMYLIAVMNCRERC